MPDPIGVAGLVPALAVVDEPVDTIGLPLAIDAVSRANPGLMVHATIPPEHPAYAAIAAHALDDLSVSIDPAAEDGDLVVTDSRTGRLVWPREEAVRIDVRRVADVVESLSDNGDYVKSRSGSARSPQVSGLSGEHVSAHRTPPPPAGITLGDAVARLFGAAVVEQGGQPEVRPMSVRRPLTRAERRERDRSAARAMKKAGRTRG